jgi:anti-sigma B factor antagonist
MIADGRLLIVEERMPAPGRALITLSGECDLSESLQLEQAILRAGMTPGLVFVDMRALDFIDSTGLRALLRSKRALDANGAKLVLVGLTEPIRRILEIANLDSQFEIRDIESSGRPEGVASSDEH